MANVRIDENGLPKGPVYEHTTPVVHRTGITAVDGSDPVDTSGAVNCAGYHQCRFDITLSGTGFTSLEVQAIFWNSRHSPWFAGGSRKFTSTGQHALVADAQGSYVFLKVIAFSGTSFSLSADYALS